jgi:DNA-binding transcriptional ArsR family regulator
MDQEIGTASTDDLTTLHHPVRRRMMEFLNLHGPSTVGAVAAGLGQQVGSISHHMKTLEKAGFVEPAPELARDRRESVWRGLPRRLSWSITDFADSPTDTLLATAAERSNLQHHADKVSGWFAERDEHDTVWVDAAFSTELWATATAGELSDLADRVQELFMTWTEEVRATAAAEDEAERGLRTPVFVFVHGNPARP